MPNPSVKEILIKYLKKHGYDGLYNSWAECACETADLGPCDEMSPDCIAGYKVPSDPEENNSGFDWKISEER